MRKYDKKNKRNIGIILDNFSTDNCHVFSSYNLFLSPEIKTNIK